MYYRLLVLLIFFQPLASALGQGTFVKGGINVSSVAGIAEERELIGYHFGVGGNKEISSNLAIKHALIFSQQGSVINADSRLVYYYLNVPILLNVRLGHSFFLGVGPQAGIALRGLRKGESDVDVTANLRAIDISASLGLSYRFTESIFAEAVYNIGVTNLSRISESDIRNSVFQGSVGYYFKRKSRQQK